MTFVVGKCDAFVAVQFAANPEIKTEVIKKTLDPVCKSFILENSYHVRE